MGDTGGFQEQTYVHFESVEQAVACDHIIRGRRVIWYEVRPVDASFPERLAAARAQLFAERQAQEREAAERQIARLKREHGIE